MKWFVKPEKLFCILLKIFSLIYCSLWLYLYAAYTVDTIREIGLVTFLLPLGGAVTLPIGKNYMSVD